MAKFKVIDGKKRVTLIPGDGVGPEIIQNVVRIIDATGVKIAWEERAAGASVFKMGVESGVLPETIDSIKETRVVLKGPLETPVGFGEKSANVTLRKLFETFANIRPVKELPGVPTPYSGRNIDLVVVRENVEDLYAGIEHMQTPGVAQCLKVISRKGCEKIVRTAFEFARSEGRKRVHCATKANIMKMTEGLLKRTFEEIAPQYPDIEAQHIIIDNCCHQLVKKPEQFDVIVTTNMNGDIVSDLTSALVGGLGFAPSANLGNDIAIFEAVHGSAPKYAGKNVINPTAVLLSATMMLRHLDEFAAAQKIEHALMVTLEEGKHLPRDVQGVTNPASTSQFADAVIANLGKTPKAIKTREVKPIVIPVVSSEPAFVKAKSVRDVGADVFIEWGGATEDLGKQLTTVVESLPIKLKMISNRGTKVFPATGPAIDCVDCFRCRFVARDAQASVTSAQYLELMQAVSAKFRWVHVERLIEIDGKMGFTKAQGED